MEDYSKALKVARKPVDLALAEIAEAWQHLGLPAEDVAERVLDIETTLEELLKPVLDKELDFLEAIEQQLEDSSNSLRELAAEVGEHLVKEEQEDEEEPLLQQLQRIKAKKRRLEDRKQTLQGELWSLEQQLEEEVKHLGLDNFQDALPGSTEAPTGSGPDARIRAARQQLKALASLRQQRATEAKASLQRIAGLARELGEELQFRVALEGERPGSEGGIVVLDRNEANERFVREAKALRPLSSQQESREEALASGSFRELLARLEQEYREELARGRAAAAAGGDDCSEYSEYSYTYEEQYEDVVEGEPKEEADVSAPPRSPECSPEPRLKSRSMPRSASPLCRRRPRGRRRSRTRSQQSRPPWQKRRHPGGRSQERRRRHGRSRSREPRQPTQPRQPPQPRQTREPRSSGRRFSLEECRDGLEAMQGSWVDKAGVTYVIEDRRVRRNDGRTFGLHLGRGFIDWGPTAKYHAVPDKLLSQEVRWLNSRTGSVAWVWTRAEDRGRR